MFFRNRDKGSYYELNKKAGREFFVDPNQAPENSKEEVDDISLINSEYISRYFFNESLSKLRFLIALYLKNKGNQSKLVYIKNNVKLDDDNKVVFDIETENPDKSYKVKAYSNDENDYVYVEIDGFVVEKLLEETDEKDE